MRNLKVLAVILSLGIVMAACNNTQKGASIGTGGGALLGALIGKMAGNTAVGAALGAAVGAGTGAIIGKHMDKVKAQAAAVENAQVQEVTDANGLQAVKVTFDSGILFATGGSTLNSSAKNSLSKFATVLKNNTDCDIAIYGHTDNQGWKNSTEEQSAQKNLTLSEQRAKSVSSYLTSLGVSSSQLKTVEGQGQTNPVADNSTAAGQQQNRRVEVYMYASQDMIQKAENGTLQ
jgi:outer membrane protein OmpA-like peptidoglycan-associated protein